MVEERVKELLQGIFKNIGEETYVEGGKKFGGYYVNITNLSNPSIFIGRDGSVLRAFQYIVNVYAHKLSVDFPTVILDIDGHKEKQYEMLKTIAINAALKVKRLKEPVELKPMSASARRIIHMTLKNYPDIWTHSVGKEPRRRVIIDIRR